MSMIFKGEKGLDYAAHAAIDLNQVVADGYTFVCRYDSSSEGWKTITLAERNDILHHGLKLVRIFEVATTDGLGGAPMGTKYGLLQRANITRTQDNPDTTLTIITFDFDVTPATLPKCMEYAKAFKAAYRGPIGVYGDTTILNALAGVSSVNWLPKAYAWNQEPARVPIHVTQGRYVYGTSADENVCAVAFQNSGIPNPASPVQKPPVLRQGSKGKWVLKLQHILVKANQHIVSDGIFGPQTRHAVEQLQKFFHLPITGVVADKEWQVLTLIDKQHP